MKLNNREEPFTPICTTENVPLFVMYIKEELPEKNKSKLESHLGHCADCKMNLAYIKEILQFKHSLSIDEKTLLLKYLSDPLFYYFANNIRKKVLEDVKEIVKEAKAKVNEVNEVNNTIDARVKDFGKAEKLPKKLHQQIPYSYLVLTTSIILFLSLGISIVLALSSKYPALQSYLPFSNSTSSAVEERLPTNLGSELSINLAKTTENNRYQQLDTAIDEFLATQNREHLAKAEIIAKDIQLFYEDNYGVDLVSYYQSVPDLALDQLSICRKKLFELINLPPGDSYKQTLEKAQQLEKDLLKLGNVIEVYRTKTLISKSSVFLHKKTLTDSITKEGLEFSVSNKYLFLQGYFLLWQAKELSIGSNFERAEKALQETISVAEQIQLEDLITSASTSLAGLYHINNYDRESLTIAQKFLAQKVTPRKDRIISFLHVAGLSSFNLKYYDLADYYLKESLKLSEESNDPKAIAKSYMFLSLTLAEKKNFSESSILSSKAFEAAYKLKDETNRLNTLFMISAYYGKTKLLAGEFAEAAKAYQEALDINQELGAGFQNNLPLAQLNEGLATALIAIGESTKAQTYLQVAKNYKKSSITNKEMANCLLAFIPNSCQNNKN